MTVHRHPLGTPVGGRYAQKPRPVHELDLGSLGSLPALDGNPLLDALRAHPATAPPVERHELSERYAWAIPDEGTLDLVAAECPQGAVEIGAGTGYWARLLHDHHQVDVAAFDLHPSEGATPCWWEVRPGGPDMAGRYADRTLLLSWPPVNDPMGADTVEAYTAAGGRRIVYMGEPPAGCTGDDRLYALLGLGAGCDHDSGICVCGVTSRWQVAAEHLMPNWPWIHGQMWVLEPERTPNGP